MLANSKKYPRMRLDFFASQFPVMRISFLQGNESKRIKPTGTQCAIRFKTNTNSYTSGTTSSVLTGTDELRQRIMIALRTEYGDVATKPEFGSEIFRVRHLDINSSEVQHQLENAILNELDDILEEPGVTLKVEYGDGDFFCQNINAYVFEGNALVYNFSITE